MAERLSNKELGKRIGLSHAMVSRLRNGARLPSVRVIWALHQELSIPLEALVEAHLAGAETFGRLMRQYESENGDAA